MGSSHSLHVIPQDLSRLRQLAAVRGLVSTELRARLWPVLVGCPDAHASLLTPTKAPDSHPLARRHSTEGQASPAHTAAAAAAPAQPAPPAPSSAVSTEYAEWSEGQHKDRGTVSTPNSARTLQLLQHQLLPVAPACAQSSLMCCSPDAACA
jgi:hypothetical protein